MYPSFEALRKAFLEELRSEYDEREGRQLFSLVMYFEKGWTDVDFAIKRGEKPEKAFVSLVQSHLQKLRNGAPIQYVLGRALFMDHKYNVNPQVLIPRPETEELVRYILMNHSEHGLKVLDIGTGSGIIPIELALARTSWDVSAIDVSEGALQVARQNAIDLGASVEFLKDDILDSSTVGMFDIIVSNPPYITKGESTSIHSRVVEHEPHIALFVKEDPLQFYKAIDQFARKRLNHNGSVYLECHEDNAHHVAELYKGSGYAHVELRNDLQNKPRMVIAQSPR